MHVMNFVFGLFYTILWSANLCIPTDCKQKKILEWFKELLLTVWIFLLGYILFKTS